LTVLQLEELSWPALDRLDRARTVVLLPVSPLEEHGPHLPLGVDGLTARHLARTVARRLTARRRGWSALLAPTLHLGSCTFEAPGTVRVRPRVVRDAVADWGEALGRAGFRWLFLTSGHAGPTHLAALEEAADVVHRRTGMVAASLTGPLVLGFRAPRFRQRLERALGRPLSAEERRALAEDAHAGWWETSLMVQLRPDLVDPGYRDLPAARYPELWRLLPNYPVRGGGRGYVGHPALADPAFARASAEVLLEDALALVEALLDGRRSRPRPFARVPIFRADFWPWMATAGWALAALAWLRRR
jgi:creatinine amidohydrolase